jgi:hypothetical protein
MRQIIGKFKAIENKFKAIEKYKSSLSVTVFQECILDNCGVVISHRKVYVDDDGEELIPTEDSQKYLRKNGNSIRKVGSI